MAICSVGCILGFVYVVTSQKEFNRRKALYYLHQYIALGFVIGMMTEGALSGALVVMVWMLAAAVVYRRLKYPRTEKGLVSASYTAATPRALPANDFSPVGIPERERVSLTSGEEVIFEGMSRGYYQE